MKNLILIVLLMSFQSVYGQDAKIQVLDAKAQHVAIESSEAPIINLDLINESTKFGDLFSTKETDVQTKGRSQDDCKKDLGRWGSELQRCYYVQRCMGLGRGAAIEYCLDGGRSSFAVD